MTWRKMSTQYESNRIQRTEADADRSSTKVRTKIEAFVQRGGPQSFAEGLVWRELCRLYPEAVRQIRQDLRPNTTDPARFQQLREQRAAAKEEVSRWKGRLQPVRKVSAEQRARAKWGERP